MKQTVFAEALEAPAGFPSSSNFRAIDVVTPALNLVRQQLSTPEKTTRTEGICAAETLRFIDQAIDQIDALIEAQLNEVLHRPEYQALEATWRGIEYIAVNTDLDSDNQLYLWDVSKERLAEMFRDGNGDFRK